MARRYLIPSEIDSALARGKTVECFLGPCEKGGAPGIRWLSLAKLDGIYRLSIYESADLGNEDFTDLYEFGPLDPLREFDEPDTHMNLGSLSEAIEEINSRFPEASFRFLNQGVIQEEYLDFVLRRRDHE